MFHYRDLRMGAKILLPVGLLLIICLGGLTWIVQSRASRTVEDVAQRELAALSAQYGNEVQALLGTAVSSSRTLADGIEAALSAEVPPSRQTVLAMIKGVADGNDDFMAAGSCWEANAFDGRDAEFAGTPGSTDTGRFIPYQPAGSPLTVLEDYETSAYYAEPRRLQIPYLTDPYKYTVGGREVMMTTASTPILLNGTFRGIALIDISLASLSEKISSIKVYDSGISALMTQEGVIVAHKEQQKVGGNLFAAKVVREPDKLKQAMSRGEPYLETRVDAQGDESFAYYQPISFKGTKQVWYYFVDVPKAEVLAEAKSISRITVLTNLAVVVLVLASIFFIVRAAVRPIGYLAGVAGQIAGGDLKVRIEDSRFGGEVRELSSSLKTMIASLLDNIAQAEALSANAREQAANAQESMHKAEAAEAEARGKTDAMLAAADKLEQVASIVSSASTELSAQIEQSEHGASEQAARVSETATAVEEMNATVLEVAQNADAAADVSARTRAKAEEGETMVQEAVRAIGDVQQDSLTLKEDMGALAGHARDIDRIMGVISDIADQTNLLALNAAIEAARAGDAGRGFAVVADEVRKLAEKTMASTTDVGNAIRAIQQSAEKSMKQVDTTVLNVERSAELSQQCGTVLHEIVSMADATADQVRGIATASEQQSASSEEIARSVAQVNSIAGETARAMEESAKAVSDLASQTHVLTDLIDAMKHDA